MVACYLDDANLFFWFLLDLQLLLLLHPHQLVLLLLGHNRRGGGCSHRNGVVNPDDVRCEIHPLTRA